MRLDRLRVRNFRALADLDMQVGPVNVLFGPNGSGKSTLLDAIWFFRDCAVRGVEAASSFRSHGIGILWDGAEEDERVELTMATSAVEYQLKFGLSSGRIEPFAGERLHTLRRNNTVIDRPVGSDKALLYHKQIDQKVQVHLREPEKISLGLYLDFNPDDRDAADLERLLRFIRRYHSRSFDYRRLKQKGSEVSHEARLFEYGDNAWSVLRNLHDRRSVDDRFDTIMDGMRRAFPSFDGLLLEQTGPDTVYAGFREKGRRKEIAVSGVSDGHLQLLLLLTALYSEGRDRWSLLLFDEPELSLHPWALSVFAEAVKTAAESWEKQIFIATHSPVLLSQFDPADIFATEIEDGRTRLKRLRDMDGIKDLLDEYAAGSLYMAQLVGAQAAPVAEPAGKP